MDRRDFLQCAAILISGMSASQLGFTLSRDQTTYLAMAPDYVAGEVNFLSPVQRKVIAAMAEVVIPRTDTPGAVDAGVPRFIELMAADWFNDQERSIFSAGLADMETRIPAEYGAPFDELPQDQQRSIMEALERDASDSSWYEFGNVQRQFISDAPFICQIKELTIWGFFTSKIGGTQVLRYNPMPMRFDGDYPLSPDDSTWSGSIF
ncbi:MAG: gluconate 2-dehydrogenase subunit 3 family protein [Pseudomonadota bacterium]